MASSKLLLPSSAAVFQSSPVSSTPFLCDRHRYVLLSSAPLRSLALQTQTLDSTLTARSFSDGEEALTLGNEYTYSEDEGEVGEEEEEGEEDEELNRTRPSSSSGTSAFPDNSDVKGALSKYVWSRPRRREFPQLSREDRFAVVESLANNKTNLLIALDKVRYSLAPSDFGNLLRRFIQEKKWDKVGLVFDWMKVNKKLRPQSLAVYISLMGKVGLHYRALRAYRGLTDMKLKLNKYVCNALLKSLVDASSLEKAFTLFEELKLDGFQPDSYSYSTVIAGCAKRPGAYAKAKEFMDEMASRGLKPDAFIYSSMLHVCARSGLEDEAKALFVDMHANGITPVTYHYAPLLNMYAEKKDVNEAARIFDEYQKTGQPMNEVMLNSLIKAHLSCGELEKASNLFADMPAMGCPPGEVTYSLMIDAYCKANQVEMAQSLFEDMKKKVPAPGNYVYSILISTYSKLGNAEMVTSLDKELESRKKGLSDPVLFNSVLKSFCELGMMDAVMNTLKRMNKESVNPDRATFNILICFFCKQGMIDIALHTLDDLKARKLRPNMNSYAPLIIQLSNTGKVEAALKLLSESREYGVRPSANIWCAAIDALCKENRLDEALTHFKMMADMGISPQPSCFQNILILAGTNLNVLEELLGYNFRASRFLNEVNLATILSAYEKQGAYNAMHILLDYAKRENLSVGADEGWDELISNLKQDGQGDILAKLAGQDSATQLSTVSSAS